MKCSPQHCGFPNSSFPSQIYGWSAADSGCRLMPPKNYIQKFMIVMNWLLTKRYSCCESCLFNGTAATPAALAGAEETGRAAAAEASDGPVLKRRLRHRKLDRTGPDTASAPPPRPVNVPPLHPHASAAAMEVSHCRESSMCL